MLTILQPYKSKKFLQNLITFSKQEYPLLFQVEKRNARVFQENIEKQNK